MKLALAQYEVVRGDPTVNLAKIRGFVDQAKAEGACALFLPEMCTTGFDWQRNSTLLEQAKTHRDEIAELAEKYGIGICGSFLEATTEGRPANTLYYFERTGAIVAHYRKVHLFSLFNEEKYAQAGNTIVTADTELGRIGCSICYDLRFPELFRKCALEGAVIQVLPAAFPHPRLAHWRTLVQARAIENQVYFIATNQCGLEEQGGSIGDTRYFGHSMVVDPWGEILLEANESSGLFTVEIDLEKITEVRSKMTVFDDRRSELY